MWNNTTRYKYFLVFGYTHGVWLRLREDDVSELFFSVPYLKDKYNDSKWLNTRVL
jgi:hypothetical protein